MQYHLIAKGFYVTKKTFLVSKPMFEWDRSCGFKNYELCVLAWDYITSMVISQYAYGIGWWQSDAAQVRLAVVQRQSVLVVGGSLNSPESVWLFRKERQRTPTSSKKEYVHIDAAN